jgi:hypothetical protein
MLILPLVFLAHTADMSFLRHVLLLFIRIKGRLPYGCSIPSDSTSSQVPCLRDSFSSSALSALLVRSCHMPQCVHAFGRLQFALSNAIVEDDRINDIPALHAALRGEFQLTGIIEQIDISRPDQ